MSTKQIDAQGVLLVVSAAILWGTTGTAQHFAPAGSTPETVGALRLLVGGLGLFVIALFRDRRFWRLVPKGSSLAAGLFVLTYQLCFFWGVKLTGVAFGTLVAIGSAPVFAGILDSIRLRSIPQPRWFLSTFLAICGCALMTAGNGDVAVNPTGVLMSAGAGLSYGLYTLLIKVSIKDCQPEYVTAFVFMVGAIFSIPILFIYDVSWVFVDFGILIILHLGIMATTVSYFLFSKGLHRLQVSQVVTLSLAEPLTASILGVFLIGEALTIQGFAGMVLLFAGLVILTCNLNRAK